VLSRFCDTPEEATRRGAAVQDTLLGDGLLEPVSAADEPVWVTTDLRSLVELRLGRVVAAQALTPAVRTGLIAAASTDGLDDRVDRNHRTPFWLLHDGQRVGTYALEPQPLGRDSVCVSSLFVEPPYRVAGLAKRVLLATRAAAVSAGLAGLRLDTEWCWQPTVRAYLAMRLWVRHWKDNLLLVLRDDLPDWSLVEAPDGTLAFVIEGQPRFTARRAGTRLQLEGALDARDHVTVHARATFSVLLATRGFPLITSDEAWHKQVKQGWSELGGPEGFAFRLRQFERWARQHRWHVETPAIPGLPDFE